MDVITKKNWYTYIGHTFKYIIDFSDLSVMSDIIVSSEHVLSKVQCLLMKED